MILCSRQNYKYDIKGQLLAVVDASGKAVEQYVYDPAGNILSKTIGGKATTYMYDKANQLVSSSVDGVDTDFSYDAAGRLTQEGDKSYSYGWLDKVMSVARTGNNGGLTSVATNNGISSTDRIDYEYGIDGQLASTFNAKTQRREEFLWDGLALIARGENNYLNEPAITGGNPILAFSKDSSKVLFDDMLGNTLGSLENGKFNAINRTAFGAAPPTADSASNSSTSELSNFSSDFFTGKPSIPGLGYSFLFRNYRSEQGKWQTADPAGPALTSPEFSNRTNAKRYTIGYPDGWNNLAYCNNSANYKVDPLGLCVKEWWGWVRCGERSLVGSIPGTYIFNIPGSVTATCGGSTANTFTGTINLSAWGFGSAIAYAVTIEASLTGDPHDGTGGGSITKGGIIEFTWTETWYEYPCGEEEIIYSNFSGPNASSYTISSVACVHE
ncbi:MAG: hypothetical protein WC071_12995 [Victivallaceae bacterium]